MRDKYFLAWGREADENGPERDDTIGKIVSIESCFVELEILSVNGTDIEQEGTILSSLDELELRVPHLAAAARRPAEDYALSGLGRGNSFRRFSASKASLHPVLSPHDLNDDLAGASVLTLLQRSAHMADGNSQYAVDMRKIYRV